MAVINLTNAAANAVIMSVINDIDADGTAGTVKVYNGTIAVSPETAIGAQVLLSEHTLSYPCVAAKTVTTASWAASVSTYTITAHGLTVGARVKFSGFTPSGYNGEYTVTAVTANTIDVAETSDPGVYSSGSVAVCVDLATVAFDTIADDTSANAGGTATWARFADSSGDAVMDVDAGEGSEALVFNTALIVISTTVSVDSFTLSV